MVAVFFFYLFAAITVASAVMVVTARNPVHSVLFLILCFFNAAGLFVLLGAEFLAMILVVVYVGAVAVLFLFVVMMLDVDFVQLREGMLNYLPVGATIGFIVLVELALVVVYVGAVAVLFLFVVMMLDVDFVQLREGMLNYLPVGATIGFIVLVELALVVGSWVIDPATVQARGAPTPTDVTNTEALGRILYTDFIFYFQAAGLVLLVAMVGAIVLTLRHKEGVKRQNISDQVARTPATAIEVIKVKPGQGI